jgi:hypothetical protein
MLGGRGNESSASLKRFGRDLRPEWTYEVTYHDVITAVWAPPLWTFTPLIAIPVPNDKNLYIYGYYISTEEPNRFWVTWWRHGTLYVNEVEMPDGGTIHYEDTVPINVGYPANKLATDPADWAYIYIFATVSNPNVTFYQGGLLIAEESLAETAERGEHF